MRVKHLSFLNVLSIVPIFFLRAHALPTKTHRKNKREEKRRRSNKNNLNRFTGPIENDIFHRAGIEMRSVWNDQNRTESLLRCMLLLRVNVRVSARSIFMRADVQLKTKDMSD